MDSKLAAVVRFLNKQETRATYGAVGGLLGYIPISIGARLGDHSIVKSWIVSAKPPNLPTGYSEDNIHPNLRDSKVIKTAAELRSLMQQHGVSIPVAALR